MSSQIKMHRRNQAVEADEYPFRMSYSSIQTNLLRQSYQHKYQPILTLRLSDMSQVSQMTSRARPTAYKQEKDHSETINQRTPKNLLTTFTNLQQKLEEAKKQLKASPNKQSRKVNLQEDSSEGWWERRGGNNEDPILGKIEESTINLQSNKRLINLLKSKERLIWANKIKTYYLKEVALGVLGINERALEHISLSLETLKSCQQIDLPSEQAFPRVKVSLPLSPQNASKKVLVLDLDETLFHCEERRKSPDDLQVSIPVEKGAQKVYLSIRPYAISFLKRAKKNFEIIAFTASEKCYADAILNQIDPDYEYIQHRLYRQHCVRLNSQVYIKDLSIINRDLSKMVLVDNSPFSYLYQIQNAIPILPYEDGEDSQLLSLEKYLDRVRLQKDVRHLNLSTFKLHNYCFFDDCQQLVKQLYCQSSSSS